VRARLPLVLALLAPAGASCMGHAPKPPGAPPAASASSRAKGRVLVGPGALTGSDVVLGAWIAYGKGKLEAYDKHPPPPANESADDFATELAGREAQSAFWAAHRAEEARPDAELDRQVAIWRAGFLPEMVVAARAYPGWTVPGATVAALRLEDFVTRFAGRYPRNAPVVIQPPSGKQVPDEPGADFPDPATLPLRPASCAVAVEARQAAWKSWDAQLPKLGGAPIAAASPQGFGRALIAVKNDRDYTSRGATWVSARVAHLAMVDGFCAAEAKDWPRAIAMLGRAVALDPANPHARLEQSLALTMMRRFDEALAEVDRALGSSDDGCVVGLGWRRRGYILFEEGALEAARYAYQKSLDVEPGNAVAEHELEAIAAAIARSGGMHERRELAPPPSLGIKVTGCRSAVRPP
jgi:tetratricopeptide (TPR) repeat protein